MAPVAQEVLGPRLFLTNTTPDAFVRPYRAFALDIGGDARIIVSIRHIVGRFTFYQTEYPVVVASYCAQPRRRFPVRLRWNVDEAGECELERVFRHKGALCRIDRWYHALDPQADSPLNSR